MERDISPTNPEIYQCRQEGTRILAEFLQKVDLGGFKIMEVDNCQEITGEVKEKGIDRCVDLVIKLRKKL